MLARNFKKQPPAPGRVYDFVIVGSGYGGAITAARIARAGLGKSVCMLERGKEWEVGKFPNTLDDYLSETRSQVNRLGLYEILNYEPISVIKGNGLGGTSLVNANVAIVPEEEVFKLDGWPGAINLAELLPYYGMASEMLAVSAHPKLVDLLKYQSLKRRAIELGIDVQALKLAVNFTIDGKNDHGAFQKPCTNCGDCVTGCNVGAKNTLYMNYLPAAAGAGVEMYTQMKVTWVERLPGGGWRVHGKYVEKTLDLPGEILDFWRETDFQIDAHNVILSAGAINTTEILLRSSNLHGLSVSPMVGSRFGGNGDFFGLCYNADFNLESLGWGNHPPNPHPNGGPGPTITAALRYNAGAPLGNRFTIEDLSFPRAFVEAAQRTFSLPFFRAEDTDSGDTAAEQARVLKDQFGRNGYDPNGALNCTMLYLCMGFDDARGFFKWEAPITERDGRVSIVWPGAGGQPIFGLINEEIRRLARSLGGSFLANPLFTFAGLRHLITAHPLGGCPIGEDHVAGAIDQYGRVFRADGEVHQGLFVADGSALPSALAVNPFLTISAVSERIAEHKIRDMKGSHYPARPAMVAGFSRIDPIDVVGKAEQELERIFQAAPTGTLDAMLNTDGPPVIDQARRQIVNRDYWKGFFPKGHILNQMSAAVFTSFRKKFWKAPDGRYLGKTSDTDKHILADNTLEEVEIKEQTGDLKPGRYILLRYTNPEWSLFYDIFKVVNDEVLIGRVYFGTFPNGIRQFTFPMTRRYDYSQMTVTDHEQLWAKARVPTAAELQGAWRMDTISNANASSGVASLAFDNKPDGRLEARYQLMGLLEGLVVPSFVGEHFQLNDFTQFHDEIRVLDKDLMIGKWVTDLPATGLPFRPDSFGIFHAAKDPKTGKDSFGFYYLLHRAGAALPMSRLFDPILNSSLPKDSSRFVKGYSSVDATIFGHPGPIRFVATA
jgi:cholesterol oxidase